MNNDNKIILEIVYQEILSKYGKAVADMVCESALVKAASGN